MQVSTATAQPASTNREVKAWVDAVRAGFTEQNLAPYIGPGLYASSAEVPNSEAALAAFIGKKLALPKRARSNFWAAAQYVESQKHRATIVAYMAEAFATATRATPFHEYLAGLPLPLIVDTWYDGGLRTALQKRSDWIEVQGISRAGIGESRWLRAYDPAGAEVALERASQAKTVLYKPHGSVTPAKNFLASDADYVEVLTEIDIQSPIPEVVKDRRAKLGFVYLGCRFHDQTLRIYARQITKRSKGPHYVVIDPAIGASPNERRILKEMEANVIVAPWADVCAELARG
jgi:SIR2-like domain